MRRRVAFGAVLLVGATLASCGDSAVTLPDDWNTLHQRRITVDIFTRASGDDGLVRPLQGIDGAPLARHPDLPDLTLSYWDRPGGTDEPDGAHVDVVRVAPEVCALALDGMYLGGPADAAGSFDFGELDRHLASVEAVRGDGVLLHLALAPDGVCPGDAPDPSSQLETWTEVATSVTRYAAGEATWGTTSRGYPIAGVQLFRVGSGGDDAWLELIGTTAQKIAALMPEVALASPEIAPGDEPDALERLLARAASGSLPLDVISLALEGDAAEVRRAIGEVASRIDELDLDLEIALTRLVLPAIALPYTADSALGRAHLGASEMATRIVLQPLPVRWFLSGNGPWRTAADVSEADPLDDAGLITTPYFDRDGVGTPAFVLRMPIRQITGERRVAVTTDAGDELVVLASLDDDRLSVVIAQPATTRGIGSITYDLVVPEFTLPTYPSVRFRLAELDQSNGGVTSFFFSDLGTLPTDSDTGDVHLRRTLPVPGVHFIEIDQPLP